MASTGQTGANGAPATGFDPLDFRGVPYKGEDMDQDSQDPAAVGKRFQHVDDMNYDCEELDIPDQEVDEVGLVDEDYETTARQRHEMRIASAAKRKAISKVRYPIHAVDF
jgi:hypothetical protein